MTFQEWRNDTKDRIQEEGFQGAKRSVLELVIGGLRRFDRTFDWGTPIWEKDWEVLIILDACRADLMGEVADEYRFVDTETMTSVAGGSRSWMLRNFSDDYIDETRDTIYVTGNPFSDEVLRSSQFHNMEEVWKYAWDDTLNTVPARALTDVAIHQWRNKSADRMIVHYMQPHHPFVPDPMDTGMNKENLKDPERPIWEKLRDDEVEYNEVWNAYKENLRYVLDDVHLLLKNLDSQNVAISADHGNAVGEIGFYGHGDVPIPSIRKVPWCKTVGHDTKEYKPDLKPEEDEHNIQEKLRDLGYL